MWHIIVPVGQFWGLLTYHYSSVTVDEIHVCGGESCVGESHVCVRVGWGESVPGVF